MAKIIGAKAFISIGDHYELISSQNAVSRNNDPVRFDHEIYDDEKEATQFGIVVDFKSDQNDDRFRTEQHIDVKTGLIFINVINTLSTPGSIQIFSTKRSKLTNICDTDIYFDLIFEMLNDDANTRIITANVYTYRA